MHADLREKDWGNWEGLTAAERERVDLEGETTAAHRERTLRVLRWIAERHAGGRVVVVTHGGSIRRAQASVLGVALPVAGQLRRLGRGLRGRVVPPDRLSLEPVEDYTSKYKGEQVEVALFGGEYQEGVLTAYCYVDEVAHIELNGHILVPLQNIASLHCSSRCDAPQNDDWPPRGLLDDDGRGEPEDT